MLWVLLDSKFDLQILRPLNKTLSFWSLAKPPDSFILSGHQQRMGKRPLRSDTTVRAWCSVPTLPTRFQRLYPCLDCRHWGLKCPERLGSIKVEKERVL